MSPGISTYCTLGLVQDFSGVLTLGFYSGLATNRPGRVEIKGATRRTTIKSMTRA